MTLPTAQLFILSLSCADWSSFGKGRCRVVQDSADDGLPICVVYKHKMASQAPDIPDLPLYYIPCQK
jgi:hypothetical protein